MQGSDVPRGKPQYAYLHEKYRIDKRTSLALKQTFPGISLLTFLSDGLGLLAYRLRCRLRIEVANPIEYDDGRRLSHRANQPLLQVSYYHYAAFGR